MGFLESTKPFLFIAKLCGVHSIEAKTGSYSRTFSQIFILLLQWPIIIFGYCMHDPSNMKYTESSTLMSMYVFYIAIVAARFALICILQIANFKREVNLYQTIDCIDAALQQLGKGEELCILNESLYKKSCAVIAATVITHFTMDSLVTVTAFYSFTISVYLHSNISAFISSLLKCSYYLWTCAIRDRLVVINNSLREIEVKSKKSLGIIKLENHLSAFMELHRKIRRLAAKLGKYHEWIMIFHIIIIFVIFFFNGYICTYALIVGKENDASFILTFIKNQVFIFYEFNILIYPSHVLVAEAEKTKEILNNIHVDPYNNVISRLIISSLYELKENKLEINVCRLFSINYTTLFIIFSTVANYVFIMMQMENDGNNRNNSNFTNSSIN